MLEKAIFTASYKFRIGRKDCHKMNGEPSESVWRTALVLRVMLGNVSLSLSSLRQICKLNITASCFTNPRIHCNMLLEVPHIWSQKHNGLHLPCIIAHRNLA